MFVCLQTRARQQPLDTYWQPEKSVVQQFAGGKLYPVHKRSKQQQHLERKGNKHEFKNQSALLEDMVCLCSLYSVVCLAHFYYKMGDNKTGANGFEAEN